MREITLVGIDLAKSVYHVHAVDWRGQVVVRKRFTRKRLLDWLSQLPPCVVAMEACGGAHHWARVCARLGHTPRLMAPQFVKPFVKANKHDVADAEAIVEAASRPSMRFVAVKDEGQQVLQAVHRVRSSLISQRTALSNQLRGLLLEFGIEVPRGAAALKRRLPEILEDAEHALPARLRALIAERWTAWQRLTQQLTEYETELTQCARADARGRQLMTIPGIGPLTATALLAAVADVRGFSHGRELAAWLGLVPRQVGTGGKVRLQGISKRGDRYLRTLLIHGARAALTAATHKRDRRSRWACTVSARRGKNIAAVALANKNARTAWALLRYGQDYVSAETA